MPNRDRVISSRLEKANSHATAVLLAPILTATLAFGGEVHLCPYVTQ